MQSQRYSPGGVHLATNQRTATACLASQGNSGNQISFCKTNGNAYDDDAHITLINENTNHFHTDTDVGVSCTPVVRVLIMSFIPDNLFIP